MNAEKHASCTALHTYNMYMADTDTQKHPETHRNTQKHKARQKQTEADRDRQRQTETDTSTHTFVLPHFPTLHAALKYLAMEYITGLRSTLICLASSLSLSNYKQSNMVMPLVRRLVIVILVFLRLLV